MGCKRPCRGHWVRGMRLVLNEEEVVPIPLDDFVQEAWILQYKRASFQGAMDGFIERLAACFASSLAECLDPDLKAPTDAQLKYATAIARDLGVALPSEALRFRGAMAEFIDRFAEAHKRRLRS